MKKLVFSPKVITMRVFSVFFVLVSLMMPLQAAEIRVAFGPDKPPFSFKDSTKTDVGIEVDVVKAVLERLGHTIKVSVVPNNRLLPLVQSGEVDAAASAQGKDSDSVFFSDNFIEFTNYAVSKKVKDISVASIKDLEKYSFVIWQKGWNDLGPEFLNVYKPDGSGKFKPNYNETNNQRSQNQMFWSDRVDLIIVDKTIFEYYKKELGREVKTDFEITYHDIFKSKAGGTGYPVAFKDKKLRDQFNDGLKTIRADGTYQKILAKYKG